jgi:long-chain-fatty-acid--CoA ligase ACSBG
VIWTTDIKTELPIFLTKEGNGSIPPQTMFDIFEKTVRENANKPSLHIERGGKWVSWTWQQFYNETIAFAKALIVAGVHTYKTVNILATNAPEWVFSFLGGIYACAVPVGVYTTNNTETCMYIAEHSEVGCLVVDSVAQYKKFEKDLGKLSDLKVVVFFGDVKAEDVAKLQQTVKNVQLVLWKDFINLGLKSKVDDLLAQRVSIQKPGNCCDIVYTSGTTGFPKAVMLTHDNLSWTGLTVTIDFAHLLGNDNRVISYLPLSHIASQYNDIISN